MPNEFSKTENSLEQISVEKLSSVERERSWQKIVMKHREAPVVSPYSWMLFVHSRVAVTVAALVIVVLGGGTVTVADSAKPGDTLYALDRAAENVRLVLAGNETKSSVQLAFAEERLQELDEIISEESSKQFAVADTSNENQGARMMAPVSALKKAETAADQLQTAENATMAALNEDADMSAGSAPAPVDGEASATLMMAAEAPVAEEAQLSYESVEKISEGIENAIANLEEVSATLDEKDNEQARESVAAAAERLEEKLNAIPVDRGEEFRARIGKLREKTYNIDDGGLEDPRVKIDDGGLEYPTTKINDGGTEVPADADVTITAGFVSGTVSPVMQVSVCQSYGEGSCDTFSIPQSGESRERLKQKTIEEVIRRYGYSQQYVESVIEFTPDLSVDDFDF